MRFLLKTIAPSFLISVAIALLSVTSFAQAPQATPPPPQAPRSVIIPKPVEKTLANGLRVIVVQRSEMPLVTAQLVVKNGGEVDPSDMAGVADLTASLLTRGTSTKSATQIAEAIEALGGTLNSGANWDSSSVTTSVLSSRIGPALEIVSDVVRNPAFKDEEIDRLRKQSLNGLRNALGTPASIARFAAGRVVFRDSPYGHPLSGTPESLPRIKREDIVRVHDMVYRPDNAILVIGGDMTPQNGFDLADKYFGNWQKPSTDLPKLAVVTPASDANSRRIIVVDMPAAGQAYVLAARTAINRDNPDFFPGIVSNAVLSGYSGRLNWEIRVKRGLSYGAGSSLDTRRSAGAFIATASTKNESGAEVSALTLGEISKLAADGVAQTELTPRQASLIGGFARQMETTGGLVGQVSSLAIYGINFDQLNQFVSRVQAITPEDVKKFASTNFNTDSTSLIVVGNAKLFLPDLQKQFPQVEVIPIDQLDLNSASLRKK